MEVLGRFGSLLKKIAIQIVCCCMWITHEQERKTHGKFFPSTPVYYVWVGGTPYTMFYLTPRRLT